MEERYTWIPFYAELAKALLAYKNNRKPSDIKLMHVMVRVIMRV